MLGLWRRRRDRSLAREVSGPEGAEQDPALLYLVACHGRSCGTESGRKVWTTLARFEGLTATLHTASFTCWWKMHPNMNFCLLSVAPCNLSCSPACMLKQAVFLPWCWCWSAWNTVCAGISQVPGFALLLLQAHFWIFFFLN